MKGHSIYVEQKTVYKCTCDAEFEDIMKAEAHLRRPPQEKIKVSKPKKRAARRRDPAMVALSEPEMPEPGP